MLSKANTLLVALGSSILMSSAQHLFIHGDHVDEGFLIGETSQIVKPMPELAQFKCQYMDENYVVNLQELSI